MEFREQEQLGGAYNSDLSVITVNVRARLWLEGNERLNFGNEPCVVLKNTLGK